MAHEDTCTYFYMMDVISLLNQSLYYPQLESGSKTVIQHQPKTSVCLQLSFFHYSETGMLQLQKVAQYI